MSKSHLINANIHRAKEGARVLEDIARFMLREEKLFYQIRELRHSLNATKPDYDLDKDLGGASLIENNLRVDLVSIIQANALRLQEALRVLEEHAVTISDKQNMKALRYQAYALQAKFYQSANKYLKFQSLEGLYLIIDTDIIPHPVEKIIEVVNQSAVKIVQYRNKSTSKQHVHAGAYKIKKLLDPNKLLIINDHIDIALDLADGVHLGQDDYPLERVRNITPDNFIFGISCHSQNEAYTAAKYDVSYIAIGCLFETKSKSDIVSVSIEELQKICCEVSIPVCAIGGINTNNLEKILTAQIKMAAIISHVWKTDDPLQTINNMHENILLFSRTRSRC